VNALGDLNLVLVCVAVGVSVLVLTLVLIERADRRRQQASLRVAPDLAREVALLRGQLSALAQAAANKPPDRPSPEPPRPAPQSSAPPAPTQELAAQIAALSEQVQELRRTTTNGTPAPATPPPTAAPLPRPVTQSGPVSARLLDAVVNFDLVPALTYLCGQGAAAERDVPGEQQAIAKLLLLRLVRADDRGVYLTQKGLDVAHLLATVLR
jgi:hypothetical protein